MNKNTKFKEVLLTNHARQRIAQRGIPLEAVQYVVSNGKGHNTHGEKKMYVNKKVWNKNLHNLDKKFISKFEKHILSIAIIVDEPVDEPTVVTVMHKNKRVRWN